MDPYEIEDTSDWLESPSQLDTIRHYAHMLEDEIQELKLELHSTKENISGLVDMNDQLSAESKKLRACMANLEAETTEQLAELHSLSMVRQNDKLRSELEAAKRQ